MAKNGSNGNGASKAKAAKNGRNGKTRGTPSNELIPESQLASAPAGFEEVFGERVVGWWALTPGNIIQGILRDVFETNSRFARDSDGKKKKRVYKVEVTNPTGCMVHPAKSEGDDSEGDSETLVKVDKGDLVGVDEKGFLKALARISVGQEVWVQYRGKEGPSADYPQGRHVFSGPRAKPAKVNPVTGEVTS